MAGLSKEEYLKRYLSPSANSGETKKKKRKKKVKISKRQGMKIFDDDVCLNNIAPESEDELENKLLTADEKPQITQIDVRTEEEKKMDAYKRSKMWKKMGASDSEDNSTFHNESHTRRSHDSDSDLEVERPDMTRRHDSDSDINVPRSKKSHSKRHDSDSDIDVPRSKKSHSKRHDSDSDIDVPRSKKSHSKRHDSDSDIDVPRSKKSHSKRHDSDSDIDVPRSKKSHSKRHDSDSDIDVPRSKKSHSKRHDSDSDIDVPRSKKSHSKRHDSDSDIDVPRSKKSHSKRHDSDSDIDVPRSKKSHSKRQDSDIGIRRSKSNHKNSCRNDSDSDMNGTSKRKEDMIGGGKGGLTDVQSLRDEMKERKLKESQLDQLAQQYKGNATVRRENGKRVDLNKEQEEEDRKNEKRKKKEEQYNRWGKGLKQATMISDAVSSTMHESNKPLARYQDDHDLEKLRKEEVRAGDPMAEYVARKKQQESGIKAKVLPKYRGPAPAPNRYNIMPGYRWDGVDRSNGFEKRYYTSLSEQIALEDEMYKWSVGDM